MKSPEILQAISSDYAEEGEFGDFVHSLMFKVWKRELLQGRGTNGTGLGGWPQAEIF